MPGLIIWNFKLSIMERRICRNSGFELSVLGAGCWSFGGGEYWGYQDQKEVNNIVHASVNSGINYFDTAEVYNEGRSELSLGEAIKDIPRDQILIGSKISPSNCYRNKIIEHCEASLKRLKTDYIDIYMIHWPIHPHSLLHFTTDPLIIRTPPDINEALQSLQLLKQQGKIRSFGVSNFSRSRLKDLPLAEISVNQLPYNLFCRAVEYDALSVCTDYGIGVIGYMALMQGILADNFPTLDDVPIWQCRTRHFDSKRSKECRHGEEGAEEETNTALEKIRSICRDSGISMAELALKWILMNSAITCTLAGSRNVSELKKNVDAVKTPLRVEVKYELDKITLPLMEKLGNHFDYFESASNDRTL